MFLDVSEAIKTLRVVTGQNCNEITLLHYIWNGYLDLYIRTNKIQKIDIVSVGYYGYQCDDEWFVYNLGKSCDGEYLVKIDDLKASELLSIFEDENLKMKITSVYHSDSKHSERAFLSRKAESSMSMSIKKFYEYGSDELIDICEINESLGLGYYFNKFSFYISESQLKKLNSNNAENSSNAGIDIKNQRQDTVKEVILWLAGHIYIKDKTLTKERLAMDTIEHLQKNINKLNAKKEKLNISGEIILPKWETVRRWKDLSNLMDKIKKGEKV